MTLGVLLCLAAFSCSKVRLEFPEGDAGPKKLDDKLSLSGNFCTSDAGDIKFPVKIMFIIDGSGSLQFADQNRQRVVAVVDTIERLLALDDYSFKIIVFNATVQETPEPGGPEGVYSSEPATLRKGMARLGMADTITDYQGALAVAFDSLRQDMLDVLESPGGQAELSRTRYINILITDGLPDPQCQIGLCNDIQLVGGVPASVVYRTLPAGCPASTPLRTDLRRPKLPQLPHARTTIQGQRLLQAGRTWETIRWQQL